MGKVGDEERRRGYFEAIHRESERLGTMIDNVLDFSRLERGKALYEKVEVDVGEVVTTAVEVFRLRLDRQAIELKMRIEPDLPTVLADRHALSLAVFNMIDNALKYAEGTREIRVHVTSSTDNVRICVEDDGPGLPTDELTRVFERFFRGAAATRGRQRGSGIGLSLVQSVARGHGGKAWVDSEPGRGARFTIELPALTS
jgi:signal transduction histidine kinase